MTRARTAPIEPGAMLAGKYRVERLLGEGGMGIVVAARHTQLDQRVAVKFMRAETIGHGDGVDRFLREARAAARLEGDHVVRVFDIGTLDDGAPYIVMECLDGRDLGAVLAERGKLVPAEAGAYVLEACDAMVEAHAQGIVHRDLKPENLFLARRPGKPPLIKVLDFGISKLLETTEALSSTKTSVMMGSPAYMSPEQMQSPKYVDGRTDIWSLGVILYQLTSGQLPFYAESVLMLSALVLTQEPPPLQSVAPEIPPAFAAVVHRCLSRDLTRRFQTVDELAEALAASLVGLPVPPEMAAAANPTWRTPPAGVPRATPATGNDATMPAMTGTPLPMLLAPSGPMPVSSPMPVQRTPVPASTPTVASPRRHKLLVPALAAGSLIAGIAAFALVRSGTAGDPAPAPAPAPEPAPAPVPAPAAAPVPAPAAAPTPDAAPAGDRATPPPPPRKPVKKPTRRPKPKKERPDDDPFGTLQ